MWRNGSAGKGRDLTEFYNEVCKQSNVLSVRNLSYRSSLLPIGGIYHLNVDGALELSVEGDRLFGGLKLTSISDSQSFKDKLPEEDHKRILLRAVEQHSRLIIDGIQNYQESHGVSLYSGDPTHGESWSFHCNLPRKFANPNLLQQMMAFTASEPEHV